jgi:hypothetical protein
MQQETSNSGAKAESWEGTPHSKARKDGEITARMHFHAIHNMGEQLRRSSRVKTGRMSDRMVGR